MVSRRNVLHLLAGAAVFGGRISDALSAGAQTVPTSLNFAVPPGACDCHVHVSGDPRRFPLSADRPYTPPPAPVKALRRVLDELHMDRVIVVSPAVYGDSNECTLDAIRQLGSRARGIALYSVQTSGAELARLRRAGIRGLRLNFETLGVTDPKVAGDRFRVASMEAGEQDLHIQINAGLPIVEALEQQILNGPVTVVFDHFAHAEARLGVDQPGFAALVRLLRAGRAYVKISAAYRISAQPPDYLDAMPLARELIDANPRRILWGSDWPHPDAAQRPGRRAIELRPPLPVNDLRILNQLAVWAPDPTVRHAILVENPARLYGFES